MIGIFDSGLGGLTALKEVHALLPHTDLLYFGDTARMPYGGRSDKTLIRYTREAVSFLTRAGASRILAACGTVSSVVLPTLRDASPVPVYGVVDAAAKAANGRRIAVIATAATARSHAFRYAIRNYHPTSDVCELACPIFAPMVENGLFSPRDPVVCELVRRALLPLKDFLPDTVVLGCTHFPLLREAIENETKGAHLIDVGKEAARTLLPEKDAETGSVRICVSDANPAFRETARLFLGEELSFEIEEVVL